MKSPLLTVLAIPAGLLLGYLGGRAFAPDGSTSLPTAPMTGTSSATPRSSSSDSAGEAPHNLKHLTRLIKELGGDDALERQLERMEISELQALALTDWPDSDKDADQVRSRHFVQKLIASELFRRQGFAALEWADQLEGGIRGTMLKQMTTDAAESDPVLAKPWVAKVMNDYGRIGNYAMAAENGAKARSAEELAEVYELYSGLGMSDWGGGSGFADDFDFSKFVSLTLGKKFISSTITAWAARDRDAALASLIEHSKEQAEKSVRYSGALFQGARAAMGDDAAARWICGKLDEFPAETRDQVVKSLRGNAQVSRSEVEAFMTALPSPQDRLLYASEVISPYGNTGGNEAALAAFKTPEAQTEVLLEIASKYRRAVAQENSSSNKAVDFFQNTIDRLNFPDASRQQIMDSLHQPPDEH